MKTDRELLEAAAKAIGLYTTDPTNDDSLWCEDNRNEEGDPIIPRQGMLTICGVWNPITSSADRYELCKKLELVICFKTNTIDSATQTACWTNDEDEGRVIVEFAGRVG